MGSRRTAASTSTRSRDVAARCPAGWTSRGSSRTVRTSSRSARPGSSGRSGSPGTSNGASGERVKVKTAEPVDGRRVHEGALVSADEEAIVIATEGGERASPTRTSPRRGPSSSGRRQGAGHEPRSDRGAEGARAREGDRVRDDPGRVSRRRWPPPTSRGGSSRTRSSTRRPSACARRSTPRRGDLRVWVQELERIEHEDEEGEITVETKVLSEQEVPVTDEFMGRIAAQTAKQVIYQKLRDAEREMTYEEFAGREGDIVTGIIQQDHRYTLLDLGKVEALLPQAEQVPSEPYRHGERLKALHRRGPQGHQGPADRRVADAPGAPQEAVRARGARDRRGHRRDQGRRPRARAPFEDRGRRRTSRRSTRWARASARRARASAWW